MLKSKKFLTEKQKFAYRRKLQLQNFGDWVSLRGHGDHVAEYVELNAWELREYLESLWQDGMTWENYRKEWCVDHIVALKYFDPFNFKDMELCWNYNNLVPATMGHNHAKGYAPEVSERMLMVLPESLIINRLLEKARTHIEEFEVYYLRP
jgi:5-methylcytosine-specific restriction endonuclease McrA